MMKCEKNAENATIKSYSSFCENKLCLSFKYNIRYYSSYNKDRASSKVEQKHIILF